MLRSCPSCSVQLVTETPTCFFKVCCRLYSLFDILSSLHYSNITNIYRNNYWDKLAYFLVYISDAGSDAGEAGILIYLINIISVLSTDLREYEEKLPY